MLLYISKLRKLHWSLLRFIENAFTAFYSLKLYLSPLPPNNFKNFQLTLHNPQKKKNPLPPSTPIPSSIHFSIWQIPFLLLSLYIAFPWSSQPNTSLRLNEKMIGGGDRKMKRVAMARSLTAWNVTASTRSVGMVLVVVCSVVDVANLMWWAWLVHGWGHNGHSDAQQWW